MSPSFEPSVPATLTAYPAGRVRDVDVQFETLHMAIGMFDGVHLGHQAVIRQAMAAAAADGHFCAVLTFDPHPSRILHPQEATQLLMPLRQRIRDMLEVGADCVFVQAFTREYSKQDAMAFIPALKERFPNLASVHVGENFRFGSGRRGNIDTLRRSATAAGVEVHALERQRMEGMAISSSRIRAAMMEGSIDEVNAMLGHPYTASGRIIPGKGLGRTLSFPTYNIDWAPEVLPRFGVYRARFLPEDGTPALDGLANYGLRPTVEEGSAPLLEVHLLNPPDESAPRQGDSVRVELLEFIRPEKAFDSVEALQRQIQQDVAGVRARSASGGGQSA